MGFNDQQLFESASVFNDIVIGLSHAMNVPLDQNHPLEVFSGYILPHIVRNRISTGEEFLNRVDKDTFRGVTAHELAHMKNKHLIKQKILGWILLALGITIFLMLVDVSTMNTRSLALLPIIIALMILGSIPYFYYSRQCEYDADRLASKYVGSNLMIYSLQNSSNIFTYWPCRERCLHFLDYPSWENRIRHLRNL